MVVPVMGTGDARDEEKGCNATQRSDAAHAVEQPEWAQANRKHQATPCTHALPRGGRGRRRLGYAGGTRRSAQSVGLDAVETVAGQVFGCTANAADNYVGDSRHDRTRVADAAD